MKGKKDVKKAKQGRPPKDLLPAGFGKVPREPVPVPAAELSEQELQHDFQVPSLCPLWPGDEAAAAHDFGVNSPTPFEDPFEFFFPPSVTEFAGDTILWKWPEEVCPMNEIPSRFSKRYNNRASLMHQNTVTVSKLDGPAVELSIDEAEKIMAVVTTYERNESADEFEARKAKELEKQAAQKNKKAKPEEVLPGKIREVKLGNLEMGKPLPNYSRWMSSQLQILKDLKWKDPLTGETLWSKIYPQKDGAPHYNPAGKYWVKLHLFGAPRPMRCSA